MQKKKKKKKENASTAVTATGKADSTESPGINVKIYNQGPEGLRAVTDQMQLETRQSTQLSVAPPSKELQSQWWTGASQTAEKECGEDGGECSEDGRTPPIPRERCAGDTQRSFLLLRWIHLKMSTRTLHTEVEYGQRCYIQTAKNTVHSSH